MEMKIAKSSVDYINAIKEREPMTRTQKTSAFNQIKASAADKTAALNKIGQGFIGPVMMRLKYEGITRNILTEDIIAPGAVPVYDVADEMGKGYFLDPYTAEATISQYEGKRVQYGFRRLAEYATVQETDLLELTIDMSEYAINEAKQRIQESEDGFLIAELDLAIDAITASNPDWAGQTSHKVSVVGDFLPESFYDGAAIATNNRLEARNILLNPADIYDLYKWDLVATSVNFKDQTFAGTPITTFAGFNIFKSVMVDPGTSYMMADSDYVGRFPVRKQLEIRDNNRLESFQVGWVIDELINVMILNSGSLIKIEKS